MKTTPEKEGASSKDRPSPNTQVKGAGAPVSAGFAAQQTLLAWMLEEFNKEGWIARHSEVDPAVRNDWRTPSHTPVT